MNYLYFLCTLCLLAVAGIHGALCLDELIIAVNDGSMKIGWSQIQKGIKEGNNFFFSTLYPDNVTSQLNTSNFFYKVEMGEFTDYLIPAFNPKTGKVYTVHDNMDGGVRSDAGDLRTCTYSSIDPNSKDFNGISAIIKNAAYSMYGSSQLGLPSDGRNYLSAWGGGNGGCCRMLKNETEDEWGRSYQITAIKFDPKYVYARILNGPNLVFSGEQLGVLLYTTDIFTQLVQNVTWEVKIDGQITGKSTGGMTSIPITKDAKTAFTYEISAVLGGDQEFWPNGTGKIKTHQLKMQAPVYIKGPTTVLGFGGNVTSMLQFTDPSGSGKVITTDDADPFAVSSNDWFSGGDGSIEPSENEIMTANDAISDTPAIYKWKWVAVNKNDGLFGSNITKIKSFQFFAFSLYSLSNQYFNYTMNCPETCIVYFDGAALDGVTYVSEGWHQVIAKVASEEIIPENSGFSISFMASGFASDIQKRPYLPYTLKPDVPYSSSTSKKLSTGAIVGIIIACVVVAAVISFVIYKCARKKNAKKKEDEF